MEKSTFTASKLKESLFKFYDISLSYTYFPLWLGVLLLVKTSFLSSGLSYTQIENQKPEILESQSYYIKLVMVALSNGIKIHTSVALPVPNQ